MAVNIIKAQKTYLKAALSPTAEQVVLRYMRDSKGNDLAMSDFGEWGVIVIKQGDTIEMLKFDGMTIASDGKATLDVATNGRDLSPKPPYTGSATGEDFQPGAEVIITNDPLTTSQFAILQNENSWDAVQTFLVVPKIMAEPEDPEDAVTKGYMDEQLDAMQDAVDAAVAAVAAKAPLNSPAFTGSPTAPTPTVPGGLAIKSWVEFLLSQYEGAEALRLRNATVAYNAKNRAVTITDSELLMVVTVTYSQKGYPTGVTFVQNGVQVFDYTVTYDSKNRLETLVQN